jgi:hypothetical protein
MNYCSIDDAWKSSDYISEQLRQYENPYEKHTEKNIIENFDYTIEKQNKCKNNPNLQYNQINEQMNTNINNQQMCVFSCDDFINHLNTCQTCRIKMRNRFSSKIIERLQNVVLDNKDTILLFLIALFILVFINLLISVFRR